MKIKIIYNVDDGDGDIAIYLGEKCLFHDHGHNLNPGMLLSALGFEVEEIDEWA